MSVKGIYQRANKFGRRKVNIFRRYLRRYHPACYYFLLPFIVWFISFVGLSTCSRFLQRGWIVILSIVGLLILLVVFVSAYRSAEKKKFVFWYPWAMSLALAIVFLVNHPIDRQTSNHSANTIVTNTVYLPPINSNQQIQWFLKINNVQFVQNPDVSNAYTGLFRILVNVNDDQEFSLPIEGTVINPQGRPRVHGRFALLMGKQQYTIKFSQIIPNPESDGWTGTNYFIIPEKEPKTFFETNLPASTNSEITGIAPDQTGAARGSIVIHYQIVK